MVRPIRVTCTGCITTHDQVDQLAMIDDGSRASFSIASPMVIASINTGCRPLEHRRQHAVSGG